MGTYEMLKSPKYSNYEVIICGPILIKNEEAHQPVGLFVFSTTTCAVEPFLKL